MVLPTVLTTPRLPLLALPFLLLLLPLHLLFLPPPIHISHFLPSPDVFLAPLSRPTPLHPIMVLQHFSYHDPALNPLSLASMASHERYSEAHGYVYTKDEGLYVPSQWMGRRRSMNKVHALLRAVLDELGKGADGVEWIMSVDYLTPEASRLINPRWTDADTLIVNPVVAIHDLLPPSTLSPPPIILANQDSNGFNDGVTFFRVSHRLVTFLSQVLVISHDLTTLWHKGTGGEGPPSDQRALSLSILANPDIQEGFYEIPMRWMNAYTLPGKENHWSPHGQVHLVETRKYDRDFGELSKVADGVYEEAQKRAWGKGQEGNGLGLMPEAYKVKHAAEEWWKDAKSGIEGMVFNSI